MNNGINGINGIIQNNDVIHKTPLLKSQNCKIVKLHSHEQKKVKMKLLSCYHLQSLTNRSRLMLKPALLSCIEAEEVFFRRQFIKHVLKCSDEDEDCCSSVKNKSFFLI